MNILSLEPLIVYHKKLVRIIICGICYSAIDMLGEVFPWGLVRETIISDCLLTEGWEDHLSEIMFSQCWKVYTLEHNLEEKIKIFFWQKTMFVPKKKQ